MQIDVLWKILNESSAKWLSDNVPQLAAALAFYTIFSLAPLLIVAVYITGLIFGPQNAHGELLIQIQNLVGNEASVLIQKLIVGGRKIELVAPATVIVFAVMFIGATAVFAELHGAVNKIWEVKPGTTNVVAGIIKSRILSFVMLLGVGFLFLVSILSTAVIGMIGGVLQELAPPLYYLLINLGSGMISFLLITVLFAMIFKLFPEAKISWRPVWVGAFITSILFTVGKYLIGLYLSHSGSGSLYGAAGSLAVFILWVYYSAQVFYFGVEITHAYSRHHEANRR
jgi:membrane protein